MKRLLFVTLTLTLLIACSSHQAFREGQKAEDRENYDRAVAKYLEALAKDPSNARYKVHLERVRLRASQAHFERAKKLVLAEQYQAAILEFQMAVQFDPTNQYAQVELEKALRAYEKQNASLSELEALKEKAMEDRGQPPRLNPKSTAPMTFSFSKPTEVQDIYQAFAKAFGFNIIYDPQIKEKKITLELKDVDPQKALEITMRSAGHFYKVLDSSTIIIAPDTPQMRKDYEDLLIQTFYLSNADVKDVNNILRSIMQARNVATNQQLNAVVIRDTADKVAIAKRIIDANDKAKAEVVIDVEILQVDTNKFREIGTQLSNYSFNLGYDTGEESNTISIGDIGQIRHDNWNITIPSITLNLVKNASEAELLAKPQLRISEGEKAQLHIGDRIPIATAQFQGYNQGTTTGGYYPYTSYQYTDVGIKIDLEPRVHHNREVTLKLKVEVSSAAPSSGGDSSYLPPTISTRTITSVIRLRDGETNLLAGLIRNDTSSAKSGFPWLQDIPLLGSLFSSTQNSYKRTDLILTMTPHIVRMPDITEEDLIPVWVGTENNMSIRGGSIRLESGQEGPFDGENIEEEKPEEPEQSQSDSPDRGKGLGRRPFDRGAVTNQGNQEGRPMRLQGDEPPVPTFLLAREQEQVEDAVTFVLQGRYPAEQRLASILLDINGPLRYESVEGIGAAEAVINTISDEQIRLDVLLPQPPPNDGNLVKIHFTTTGEGPKTLRIEKGGSRDAKDMLWPISASGITVP
ncbi:MAG TPA: secretin N-terminal domain-containing protein [Thermoanaerobaculia bacterium]|nr:secretin N-terminal domain-containing protein [Thermoanaerobaculia bacterium]HUM31291.1 secretin N-terminal domain-containing protein [Thermoanaerobaculia bacterium]HXK69638.1 secretin N-terminal domain-containing protein [Thermoanaerobaculia bacterium]